MTNFAKIEPTSDPRYFTVTNVIVIELDELIKRGYNQDEWIESLSSRKNHAGIGYTYDKLKDHFVPPRSHPSWTKFNDTTAMWESTVERPSISHIWIESTKEWKEKQ
jgi:hypothetical protein